MMKKDDAKEPKALLEARAWKAKVSEEIIRKGWRQFRKDAQVTSEKWQQEAATIRATRLHRA
jgi:hypothetical protein